LAPFLWRGEAKKATSKEQTVGHTNRLGLFFDIEDGSSRDIPKLGKFIPDYTVPHLRT
jgi:hypothetical protein